MSTHLIPATTITAAKRGFIRTASQSLATSFTLTATPVLVFTQDAVLAAAVGVGGMVAGAVINGAQSFFNILSKGIPDDYQGTQVDDNGDSDVSVQ